MRPPPASKDFPRSGGRCHASDKKGSTGSNFWRSGLQDARPVQGSKRMQGTARGFKRTITPSFLCYSIAKPPGDTPSGALCVIVGEQKRFGMRSAFALRINSGKNILMFATLENLRIFQSCFFTGGTLPAAPRFYRKRCCKCCCSSRPTREKGIQIKIPSQWSISCWMICAVQPVKVLMRSLPSMVWYCTLMLCQRFVFRTPSSERQPSSASY